MQRKSGITELMNCYSLLQTFGSYATQVRQHRTDEQYIPKGDLYMSISNLRRELCQSVLLQAFVRTVNHEGIFRWGAHDLQGCVQEWVQQL